MREKELCGFYGMNGAAERLPTGYEVLGYAYVGGPTSKGVSRPALVREAVPHLKTIGDALKKAAKVHSSAKSFKAIVIGVNTVPVKMGPKAKAALDKYNAKAVVAQNKTATSKQSILNATKKAVDLNKAVGGTARKHISLQNKKISMLGDDPPPDGTTQDTANLDQAIQQIVADPATKVQSTPVSLDMSIKKVRDGVVYAGEAGWPDGEFGSYSFFLGPQGKDNLGEWGVVWTTGGSNLFGGGNTLGWMVRNGGNRFGAQNQRQIESGTDPETVARASAASLAGQESEGGGGGGGIHTGPYKGPVYGPLIGKPKGKFANLRWATEDKKWFWFPTEAPDWATVDIRNEQTLAQGLLDDAARATKKAADDAAAKKKADDEAAQAQRDAENAIAKDAQDQAQQKADADAKLAATALATADAAAASAADAAQKQAEADAAKSQQASDAAQRQADADAAKAQAAADIEQAKIDLEAQKAAADQDRQARQVQLDYIKAHPEVLAQQSADQKSAPDKTATDDDGGGDSYDSGGTDAAVPPGDPRDPLAEVPYSA